MPDGLCAVKGKKYAPAAGPNIRSYIRTFAAVRVFDMGRADDKR